MLGLASVATLMAVTTATTPRPVDEPHERDPDRPAAPGQDREGDERRQVDERAHTAKEGGALVVGPEDREERESRVSGQGAAGERRPAGDTDPREPERGGTPQTDEHKRAEVPGVGVIAAA